MTKQQLETLFDKYLSGTASPEEERLVDTFFDKQERKQTLEHYKLSEEMWASIKSKVNESEIIKGKPASSGRSIYFNRILIPLSIAASLVMGALVFYPQVLNDTRENSWTTSETLKGQKTLITLEDGSRVYLNSASAISYPQVFSDTKREIILTGEAFFEVTKDSNRPFIVRTGKVETTVLGTSFNVNAFDIDDISVAVATGKVQVAASDEDERKVLLLPNNLVRYTPTKGLIVSDIDVNNLIAWKTNTLHFEDMPLDEVAVILERWYNAEIEFQNSAIKTCRINGEFRNQRLSEVLESIQYMYNVDFKFSEPNKVELYGEGCKK